MPRHPLADFPSFFQRGLARPNNGLLRELVTDHARFPSLFIGSSDPIALFAPDGTLIAANPAAQEWSERESDSLTGSRFEELVIAEDLESARHAFARALSGDSIELEGALRVRAGHILHIPFTLVPAFVDGKVAGVYAVGKDLSTFTHTTVSRRLQELSSLSVHHPDAVMSLDLAGRCTGVNAAAEDLLEFSAEEVIGRSYISLLAPDVIPQTAVLFARVSGGEAISAGTSIISKSNRRKEVEGIAVPIVVDKKVVGVYVIGRDVTDRLRLEAAVREQAERIRELYLVAASTDRGADEQIRTALELGVKRLRCDGGYLARIEGGNVTNLYCVGDGPYTVGQTRPLDRSLSRFLSEPSEPFVVDDLSVPPWDEDPSRGAHRLTGFIGALFVVGGRPFGSVCFFSVRKRQEPFTESDRDFVRLIGALAASAIERGEQRRRLDNLAFFDALTGLPNRVLLGDRLAETIATARRYRQSFAVHFADLDGFKEINDAHGHARGDEVLRSVARRLERAVGQTATVARMGGDEFVIIQPGARDADEAVALAERLRKAIAEPFSVDGTTHALTASVGIALFPDEGADGPTLLARADAALYRVKAEGRDGVSV